MYMLCVCSIIEVSLVLKNLESNEIKWKYAKEGKEKGSP